MEPVYLAVALAPLAVYLLLIGSINLWRRPLLITGARNAAALALAVSGFFVVGPMQLFLPEAAAIQYGPLIWLIMLAFFALSVTLWILLLRPRLVIFNITADELRPVLEQVAARLDSDAKTAGDSLLLPQLGLQLHLDYYPPMRNVSLVAVGDRQSHNGWRRLQRELSRALADVEVARNPRGFSLLAVGLLLIGWPLYQLLDHGQVAQQFRDLLRL